MKKKLTVATVLILLLAFSLTLLVGCDEIFKKNDERDATQVVATVNYNGQSANVYKFELTASFNSYAPAYNSYYGMTYQQAANYILQSLAQQKLLVLYAKEKVSALMGLSAVPEDIADLLTASERNKAIEDANDSLFDALGSLIKDNITEDNYNSGSTAGPKDEEIEITDPISIRFDSNGGSSVTRLRMQKDTTVKEPEEPTKDGYTFYGWYEDSEFNGSEFKFREYEKDEYGNYVKDEKTGEFIDIGEKVNENKTLYAKWEKYTAPRTERPEAEAEEDDYDPEDDAVTLSPKFFSTEYLDGLYAKVLEEDYVDQIKIGKNETLEKKLKGYIDRSLTTLKKNLKSNIYKSTDEECYQYYLTNQMETLVVTKLERLIGKQVSVSRAEVEAEFNRIVASNKETFAASDTSYSSALTDKLSGTYFHPITGDSYGFVVNILLKLDEEKLEELTKMYAANPANKESAKLKRNQLLSQMSVKVSNPEYDSKATVKDKNNNEIELRDPMTDPNNPYNGIKTIDGYNPNEYKAKDGVNDYSKLVSFEKGEDGKYGVVYGATEHPAMAYLLEEVPAFDIDNGGTTVKGVIHQIYDSFAQVKQAVVEDDSLSAAQGVYWLREVATAWLYLVGDDSGSVTDSSNNKGLGYLVTPEGEKSSFLEEFTDYARNLIKAGTGSFSVGDVDVNTAFKGALADGTLAGNGVVYVAADSFIESGSTNNAYAGIFVLLNSYTVWDENFYKQYSENGSALPEDGTLPSDYLLAFGKDAPDADNPYNANTAYGMIYDNLLAAKKKLAYNLDVNTMGKDNLDNIVYYEKAYKSLWKDLDD